MWREKMNEKTMQLNGKIKQSHGEDLMSRWICTLLGYVLLVHYSIKWKALLALSCLSIRMH